MPARRALRRLRSGSYFVSYGAAQSFGTNAARNPSHRSRHIASKHPQAPRHSGSPPAAGAPPASPEFSKTLLRKTKTNPKKPPDNASYKLYYVNLQISLFAMMPRIGSDSTSSLRNSLFSPCRSRVLQCAVTSLPPRRPSAAPLRNPNIAALCADPHPQSGDHSRTLSAYYAPPANSH